MRFAVPTLAAALLAGCGTSLSTEPGVVVDGSLHARAESSLGLGPTDGTVIWTRVIVVNAGRRAATLTFASCPLRVRITRQGAAAPSYDESQGGVCASVYERPVVLAAGRADTLWHLVEPSRVAAFDAPRATYRVEALVAIAGRDDASRLVLDAGEVTMGCCTR